MFKQKSTKKVQKNKNKNWTKSKNTSENIKIKATSKY